MTRTLVAIREVIFKIKISDRLIFGAYHSFRSEGSHSNYSCDLQLMSATCHDSDFLNVVAIRKFILEIKIFDICI